MEHRLIQRRPAARCALLIAIVFFSNTLAQGQSSPAPQAPPSTDIVAHLERTIAWFRHIQSLEQQPELSDDVASRERLHTISVSALQLAFDFARAAAALVKTDAGAPPSAADTPTGGRGFDQAASRLTQRVVQLQGRLADVMSDLARAPARTRAALIAQRDELEAALALAKDVQSTVQNLAQFAATSNAAAEAAGGLTAQVAELQRSVPEARHTQAAKSTPAQSAAAANAARSAPAPPAPPAFRPESAGLVALGTELLSLGGDRRQLTEALRETDALLKGVDELRAPLTAQARDLARRTDVSSVPPADAAAAAQARLDLQNAAAQFKVLSTALVPLGEQGIAVESARGMLGEWRDDLGERFGSTARQFLLRGLLLVVAIGALLIFSEVWRRATFRYLHDVRRRRQFLVLRRIVVGVGVALVLVAAFVSEIGSLATYAGFVTAGVAVAMQNVILAVVAYFFLIGRYGVRVGDRITLAGVTGNVIEIGLVRIYLMELVGADLHATGRVVVLSNAVLFQPAALFKQVPGADYLWHVVTITLAPGADLADAERRLESAAESVYGEYRESIERQHATLQRFVDVETSVPRTDVRSRLTGDGLECTVRYPVDAPHAAAIDRKMMSTIRQALAADPALTVVSSIGPTAA